MTRQLPFTVGLKPETKRSTRILGTGLVAAVTAFGLIGVGSVPAVAAPVEFKAQTGGTYDGMPVFDGQPSHLDQYIDVLLDYVDFTTAVRWANGVRGDYTITTGPHTGKVVPGMTQWGEGVQGISTDFPAQVGMGQSWNTALLKDQGEVIGDEALYKQNFLSSISTFNPMVSAGQSDIRSNPLAGRIDEDYGEDPTLAGAMVADISAGISGIDDPGNDSSFWTKALVDNKHYTDYLTEWYRMVSSNDVDTRSTMEYYAQSSLPAIKDGSVGSIITSYGRTNGIPNALSPMIKYAQDASPWGANGGMYTVPDNGSDTKLPVVNAFGNGFDANYVPSLPQGSALMTVAEQGSVSVNQGGTSPSIQGLIDAVSNGTYGVTRDDVYDLASAQLVPLVREGLFNERDSAGLPKFYPFLNKTAASSTPINYTVTDHQNVALQSAQEALVLLKNDGNVLPLSPSASVTVTGPLSDARFRTTYAAATPSLPNAGLTPQQGIAAAFGAGTTNETDGNVVTLKSVATGKYLTADGSTSPTVVANGDTADSAVSFESFDWGQGAHSYRSTTSGKWLQYASNAVNVGGTQAFGTASTTLPNRIRPHVNADGTVSFVVNAYTESFSGGFETQYWKNGRYLTVDPTTGQVGVTAVLTNVETAASLNTDATKFQVDVTQKTGSVAISKDSGSNYAVVVIGQPSRNSAGEGADRSTLSLGDEQYELVANVAKAYPKRTIVVVSSSAPVALGQVQSNPNVAAIINAPDGGQYGNYALGQLLTGASTPTGRLTNTWYESDAALPKLTSYSIPEGTNNTVSLNNLDPRFTVDMTNGSPAQTGLTYMYTDAPVTYPFGYGLSYSDFDYSNLRVNQGSASTLTAYVDVKNSGSVDTAEVVQLYASNDNSAYGAAAPKRKLIGFAKVNLAAGQTKTVKVTIKADSLALWDTVKDELVVEGGNYRFEAGASSDDIRVSQDFRVNGQSLSSPDAQTAPISVFDHSIAASNVTYREASKQNTVDGLVADHLTNGYSVVMSKAAGAWTELSGIDFTGATSVMLTVASQNPSSTISLHIDSANGPKVADVSFGPTGSTSYAIAGATPAGDIPVKETAFTSVTAKLDRVVSGAHNLFVVFDEADTRVKELQLLTAAPVSSAALDAAIAGAANVKSADFTSSTFAAFTEAYNAALAVAASETATQDEIDDATEAVTSTQANLVRAVKSALVSVSKSSYKLGDAFDPATVTATAVLSDGTTRKLNNDEYALAGFDSTSVGVRTVTATVDTALLSAGSSVTGEVLVTVTSGVGPKVMIGAPVVPASGWFRSPVSVKVTADDPQAPIYVSVDSGDVRRYTGAITVSGNGTHRVQAFAVSAGDAYSKMAELTVKIDAVAPVVSVKSAESAKLTLVASDTLSGVASIQYSLNGGSTWSKYTTPVAISGAPRSVSYRATDKAGNVSAAKSVTVKGKLSMTGPAVKGSAVVGKKLTASVSKVSSGAKVSYQWLRNGKVISKATKATYKVTSSDRGKKLSVRVTATRSGYTTLVKTSKATATVKGVLSIAKPTVRGTAKVGKTLTAKVSSHTAGSALSYRWYRNGKAISGATKATHKVVAADKGKKLTVKVTAKKSGYITLSKTSASVRVH